MKNSKLKNQIKHAKARALQRYGLALTDQLYYRIVKNIQQGKDIKFVESQTNRVSVFLVKVYASWYPIVYDKHRKSIVTFLPEEYAQSITDKKLLSLLSKNKKDIGHALIGW